MPRPPSIAPANDSVIYLKGLIDTTDPKNVDGSPKYINNATGTWTLINPNGYTTREDIIANGTVIGTGSLSAVGSGGNYLVQLPNTLNILSTVDYYLRIELASGSFEVDMLDLVSSITRTGKTNLT